MSFRRVLVALDHSSKDDWVFGRAIDQVHPQASHLLITHTVKTDRDVQATMPTSLDIRNAQDAQSMYDTLRRVQQHRLEHELKKARQWIDLYLQQAIAKGVATQVACQMGNPELKICQLADQWKADLIVIGHRENQGVRQVGMNSVSQYILQHASCSVLVVHEMVQTVDWPEAETATSSHPQSPTVATHAYPDPASLSSYSSYH